VTFYRSEFHGKGWAGIKSVSKNVVSNDIQPRIEITGKVEEQFWM
jgi:hypothetical protein